MKKLIHNWRVILIIVFISLAIVIQIRTHQIRAETTAIRAKTNSILDGMTRQEDESIASVADDNGQGIGPCVISSDNMAECPLVGVKVHTKKHGPGNCPDGRRYYNSTGTYPEDKEEKK